MLGSILNFTKTVRENFWQTSSQIRSPNIYDIRLWTTYREITVFCTLPIKHIDIILYDYFIVWRKNKKWHIGKYNSKCKRIFHSKRVLTIIFSVKDTSNSFNIMTICRYTDGKGHSRFASTREYMKEQWDEEIKIHNI